MANNKRKISAAQRDKINIQLAKQLKKAGILSKKAKLHSGRFISRGVLQKVRQYTAAAELEYKAVKVSRDMAKAAKERGFQVVQGNKIIGPSSPQFRNRLKKGELTGVRPVKGGYMEEVILPHTVFDMQSLAAQLQEGIDTLKMPDEQFAFKYHGNESYRGFSDSQQLLEYLRNYKGLFDWSNTMKPEDLQEEFEALTIMRLHPYYEQELIRGPRRRRIDKQKARMEAIQRGEYVGNPNRSKKLGRKEKAARMSPVGAERYLRRMAKQDAAKRERLKNDPVKYEEYKAKAKARAEKSRLARKK